MNYKKIIYIDIAAIVGGIFLLFALIYCANPFQIFREDDLYKFNQLDYNPNLARFQKYNTAILGTSMVQDFLPSEMKQKLGWDAFKFCFQGSSAHQVGMMANFIEEYGHADRYVFALDFFSFGMPVHATTRKLREGMYAPDSFYRYVDFFDFYILSSAVGRFFKRPLSRDQLYTTDPRNKHYNSAVAIAQLNAMFRSKEVYLADTQTVRDNFKMNLQPFLNRAKGKPMVFFFPPYSMLTYAIVKDFDDVCAFKKFMVQELSRYPNIKIYDFQLDSSISYDLNNYYDIIHFHPKYTSWMVDCFQSDSCLVDSSNFNTNIEVFRKNFNDFDYEAIKVKPYSPQHSDTSRFR